MPSDLLLQCLRMPQPHQVQNNALPLLQILTVIQQMVLHHSRITVASETSEKSIITPQDSHPSHAQNRQRWTSLARMCERY